MTDVTPRIVRQRRLCVALCGCAAVAGCMVGPDYRSPSAPATDTYTASPLPEQTASSPGAAGLPQRFVPGQDIPAAWWALFHCEPLDTLIRQALVNSPNIAAAQAALRQARENFSAQAGGTLLPSVDAQLGATREKLNGVTFGEPGLVEEFNLYNASVNVSYKLDVFGGARRELEALHAQVDYQRFQLQAAYLAMSANIVTAAVKEASLRAQIEATERIAARRRRATGRTRQAVRTWGRGPYGSARAADPVGADPRYAAAAATTTRPGASPTRGAGRQTAQRHRVARIQARDVFVTRDAACQPAVGPGADSGPTFSPPTPCCIRPARKSAWPPRRCIRRSRCPPATAPRL